MKLKGIFFSILVFLASTAGSQDTIYKFWVQLSDKNYNSFSLDTPGEFLSQRAIDRRERQNISINEQDLPVSGAYLDSLSSYPLRILYTSRWMNAAIIQTGDSSLALSLPDHSFVEGVEYLYRSWWTKKSSSVKWNPDAYDKSMAQSGTALVSDHQVEMLKGHLLHQEGYEGQGMIIAVLDMGFPNVNSLEAFDSLRLNGRLLGTRNFVEPDSDFYWSSNGEHGTNVLSVMAGNLPDEFKGSAPGASYWLIQTEDGRSEFRIEEANWLAGAELADSAGADLINSSLGYLNVFTDPSQNYMYSDLDGKTALVTRAAQLAAARGMLVVTSAGNSGRPENSWGYITPPADGDWVLAVGAVNSSGERSAFSSYGPTFDQRIKPDVMAQGEGTWLIRQTGIIETASGTSFSSPVVAGLAACLWQKNPEISSYELLEAIRNSGSESDSPDTLLGYGIPDFQRASNIITGVPRYGIPQAGTSDQSLIICPNPAYEYISIATELPASENIPYQVYDIGGRIVLSGRIETSGVKGDRISIHSLESGTYFLRLGSGPHSLKGIFLKLR